MTREIIARTRNRLWAALPAPMAAPETAEQRHRRWRLIGLLAAMAVTTLMAPSLAGISQIGAALLWLGLALATLVQGSTWLTTKLRADAAWLDERRSANAGERCEP